MRNRFLGACAAATVSAVIAVSGGPVFAQGGRRGVPTGDYAVSRCMSNAERDYQAAMASIWYGWSIGLLSDEQRDRQLDQAKDNRDAAQAGC